MRKSILSSDLLPLNGVDGEIYSCLEGLADFLIDFEVDFLLRRCNQLLGEIDEDKAQYLQVFMLFFEYLDRDALDAKCRVARELSNEVVVAEKSSQDAMFLVESVLSEWDLLAKVQRGLMHPIAHIFFVF